jgi:phage shock protein A
MTERTPEQITDEFVLNLQKGNYRINPDVIYEASYMNLVNAKKELLEALDSYTKLRYESEKASDLRKVAIICVARINNAWIQELIREKPSIITQVKGLQQENTSLKELNTKLAKENDHQKKQIAELHETIDRITARGLNKVGGE